MKIILLSGAIKNAGDYLITERARQILEYCYPKADISIVVRNYPLCNSLELLNKADIVVIAGGPLYQKRMYPEVLPLVDDLDLIKSKIFIMGAGWYGSSTNIKEIVDYKFEPSSLAFLERVTKDSSLLGCRDYYSVKVLYANGFRNCIMTGCPAWYDFDKITKRLSVSKGINKIMISDPANAGQYGTQSVEIVKTIRKLYPGASVEYVFHRGIEEDGFTKKKQAKQIRIITSELEKMNIRYHNISYGFKGFHLYDDCDLHIGHRVHAHIYNLSQRNRSILIEEDARGAGVNEALGLIGIKAYERKMIYKNNILTRILRGRSKNFAKINYNATSEIENYIDYIKKTNGKIFNVAFGNMECYFSEMINHVNMIGKYCQ